MAILDWSAAAGNFVFVRRAGEVFGEVLVEIQPGFEAQPALGDENDGLAILRVDRKLEIAFHDDFVFTVAVNGRCAAGGGNPVLVALLDGVVDEE